MRPILLSVVLIFVASSNLHATEALIFDGGGYNIQILIGFTDEPVVGQLHFTSPGAKDWVVVPSEQLQVEKFDMKERILRMRFSNQTIRICPLRFPFLSKGTGPSSLLRAK
jgi:hypothetical protein